MILQSAIKDIVTILTYVLVKGCVYIATMCTQLEQTSSLRSDSIKKIRRRNRVSTANLMTTRFNKESVEQIDQILFFFKETNINFFERHCMTKYFKFLKLHLFIH